MQIAETATEKLTVAVLPSSALNKKIFEKFKSAVDTFVAVENENLDLMFSVVRGVNNFITVPIRIAYDFADLVMILKNGGRAYVDHGKAKGENAFVDAAKMALDSIKDILGNSKRILLGFFGEAEHLNSSFPDIIKASDMMEDVIFKDAIIILGGGADGTNFNSVEVIIIATDISIP